MLVPWMFLSPDIPWVGKCVKMHLRHSGLFNEQNKLCNPTIIKPFASELMSVGARLIENEWTELLVYSHPNLCQGQGLEGYRAFIHLLHLCHECIRTVQYCGVVQSRGTVDMKVFYH